MSRERFLPASGISELVRTLVAAGTRVWGPVSSGGRSEYRPVTRGEELDLRAPQTALPLKALFLPPTEPLFTWRQAHNDVTLTPVPTTFEPTVVIGARPCDAAAVEVLDKVMGWDFRDELWFGRREATTIVALACDAMGPDCFCETVGLGPRSSKGADVLLTPVEGGYLAQAVTGKGDALVEKCAACFQDGKGAAPLPVRDERRAPVPEPIDMPAVQAWLGSRFDDPYWAALGLRCHGCGACASVCPTCHCFDIVDEPNGLLAGTRRRNWDTCQASKFTLHASGHNPRADQNPRFRQRVLHKFSIYPQRFGEVLCTGCGRCVKACPAGQNIEEILAQVDRAARAETRP